MGGSRAGGTGWPASSRTFVDPLEPVRRLIAAGAWIASTMAIQVTKNRVHAHADDHDHAHSHDHPDRGLRRLAASVIGHSHDPGDSIDDALTSDRRGIRALKVSLAVLGVTALAQFAVVLISGSVALLADTIHNFSDALTAVPLWIAFAIGGRAANRRYTFGYRRAEDLASDPFPGARS